MNVREKLYEFISGKVEPRQLWEWHFGEAIKQYQHANADLSIRHFQECLKIFPEEWFALHQLSVVHSQLVGDLDESLRLLRFARRLRESLLPPPEGKPPHRFLLSMWAAQIGHIANMEHLIKREILQGRDPKNIILYLPDSQKTANEALLEKMGAYITVVREQAKLPYSYGVMLSVFEEYFLTESLDGLTKHWWHASAEIFRAWEEAGRAPLLTLSEGELKEGNAALRELGVPADAWFVCLHVRESSFKQEQGFNSVEGVLSADIGTYLPAIRAVIERGGWVIRIGDRKMRPFSPMPGVIDYAHSSLKSARMDVFLLGACRFFIGTSSGPAYVPPLFGVPCVLTNWLPAGQRPFNSRDIYIPRLYRAGSPPRPLSFGEMMAPPVGCAPGYVYADELGLAPIPNTPEEIREVVSEMLDRRDGTLSYSELDKALQSAFDAVAETNLCIGNARAGRSFLRRHRKLLTMEGTRLDANQSSREEKNMSLFVNNILPPGIPELAKKHADRNVDIFLLDKRMIERQNLAIAKAVHAFFRSTETYRELDVETIARYVDEFRDVYLESPITMNSGGANFPSGVNLYLMARCLAPELIVESGVYKGQSSYFLAAACPSATIHAFDPNLRELGHPTPGVIYHEQDWMNADIRCEPVGANLCFFDDHQSQAQRVIQAHQRGFRHVIVDDSWPIETVTGCGWPPLPSVDMIMSNPLAPGEVVKWVEMGKIWTYVHSEEMIELCARARRMIKAAYEVPSLYRECGIAPTSAYKFVELA